MFRSARQSAREIFERARRWSIDGSQSSAPRILVDYEQRSDDMKTSRWIVILVSALTSVVQAADSAAPNAIGSSVKFVPHRIGQFRSAALCVADFSGDGKLDIVAGANFYPAPDWKPVKIRTLSGEVDAAGKGYHDDFMNLPLDVDGDGKPDIVSCGWFSKSVRWYRNSLGQPGDWPETIAETSVNFECGELVDIDGDGKAGEILPDCEPTIWFEAAATASGRRGLV